MFVLQIGSVQEVKDYCKKLIDVVGKGCGYILGPRSSTDEVKPENLKPMIEFTKEYGKYRSTGVGICYVGRLSRMLQTRNSGMAGTPAPPAQSTEFETFPYRLAPSLMSKPTLSRKFNS